MSSEARNVDEDGGERRAGQICLGTLAWKMEVGFEILQDSIIFWIVDDNYFVFFLFHPKMWTFW
jgi:hypothetical protein